MSGEESGSVVVSTTVKMDLRKLALKLKELGYSEVSPGILADLVGGSRVWAGKILSLMARLGLVERVNRSRPALYRIKV